MRGPQKIGKILERLRFIWHKYPDLCLGQLMSNAFPNEFDFYYIEDKEFLKHLEDYYLGANL